MNFETVDQLKDHFENLEQTEALQVGPSWSNHQRAVFQIGTVQILMDTVLPHNWFKPSQEWYWTGDYMTETQANEFASEYNATVVDAYYSDYEEKQLMFDELDDLLRWVFDNHKERLVA